jgi:hypothetical protein
MNDMRMKEKTVFVPLQFEAIELKAMLCRQLTSKSSKNTSYSLKKYENSSLSRNTSKMPMRNLR